MKTPQITGETFYYAAVMSKQNKLAFVHTITVDGGIKDGAEYRRTFEVDTLEMNGFMSAKAFMDRQIERSRRKLLAVAEGKPSE